VQKAIDEEQLNLEVRRILKKVGITSQREIEHAVRTAVDRGRLSVDGKVEVQVRLEVPDLGLSHEIRETLDLAPR